MLLAERRPGRRQFADVQTSSARYDGHRPTSIWCISKHSLNLMRNRITTLLDIYVQDRLSCNAQIWHRFDHMSRNIMDTRSSSKGLRSRSKSRVTRLHNVLAATVTWKRMVRMVKLWQLVKILSENNAINQFENNSERTDLQGTEADAQNISPFMIFYFYVLLTAYGCYIYIYLSLIHI